MRTLEVLILGAALLACGGGNAASDVANNVSGVRSRDPSSGNNGNTNNSSGGSSEVKDAGAPSTTLMLGDGGDLQGTRLHQSGTLAMPTTSTDAGAPLGKVDEPGRRPEDIQTRIGTLRAEARACYDNARKGKDIGEGNLMFEFVIDPKGNVTRADAVPAKSEISDATTIACVSKFLKGIKWAEHTKGFETTAHYTFNFRKNVAPPK